MADEISTLPDEILCHILSYLQAKDSFITCFPSAKWKPLWLLVPKSNIVDDDQ